MHVSRTESESLTGGAWVEISVRQNASLKIYVNDNEINK